MADIIGQSFASDRGCFTLTPTLGWSPANIEINFISPETRIFVLPGAENRTIVSSFIWTKHRNVTRWRTDRQTRNKIPLHCSQCGRTVNYRQVHLKSTLSNSHDLTWFQAD